MQFIDTHCHIHDPEFAQKYDISVEEIIQQAADTGVTGFVCVGTSALSSEQAVAFAKKHSAYASLALHPHEVAEKSADVIDAEFARLEVLAASGDKTIVAIGECGLDYYYHPEESVREAQRQLFKRHLGLARKHDLPLIFHIRDAFDDFFAIIDEYNATGPAVRGVVHSFTAHMPQLQGRLDREFYNGLHGIVTFTKDDLQLAAAKAVPLGSLVLETDAPFLTPKPFRGTMCQLKHVVVTAEFLSQLRAEPIQDIASRTTTNATSIFRL